MALMIDKQPDPFVNLLNRPELLLLMAGGCLVVALRFTGRAVRPIGVIIQSAAAVAVVAIAVGIALLLIVAAAMNR
jgi:hypothetical protein